MKILFYSLHAGIWAHALPENRIVCDLVAQGHDVVYVSCGRSFPVHCTTYSAYQLEVDAPPGAKSRMCDTCIHNAGILVQGSGARHLRLRDQITQSDNARIDALMTGVTRENYLDFQMHGIEVGRIVTYELFLHFKKMSPRLNDEEWEYYQIYLRNSLLSLLGYAHIHAQESPDAVFFYSPQYDVNGVAAAYAMKQGSRVYFIEGSSSNSERYSALRIWDWSVHGLVNPGLTHWQDVKAHITEEDARRVTGHFNELLRGHSFAVYSEAIGPDFSVREHFRIPRGAKIVLATLSSYDEAYAAYMIGKFPERKVKSHVFRDQFEWIQKTIAHAAGRPDLFLIIRVHPRDYPNKRDPRQSEQASLWEKMFEARPVNVAINWPQDKISIYSLMNQVDVVVTGWSATGTEALIFGVPVVTYDQFLPSYPADIHYTGTTEDEYLQNIDRALTDGRGDIHRQAAWRWLAASFSMGTIRIPPETVIGENWPQNVLVRAFRKMLRLLTQNYVRRRDARKGIHAADANRFHKLLASRSDSLHAIVAQENRSVPDEITLNAILQREAASFLPSFRSDQSA